MTTGTRRGGTRYEVQGCDILTLRAGDDRGETVIPERHDLAPPGGRVAMKTGRLGWLTGAKETSAAELFQKNGYQATSFTPTT